MPLASADIKEYPAHNWGGGYMGGSYHYDERGGRYFVSLYWQSKHYRIYRYNSEPIWHKKTAEKLLNKIRAEIDDKQEAFDIRPYLKDSPVSFKTFSKTWLETSSACKNTKRVYQSALNKAQEFFGESKDIRKIIYSDLVKLYNWLPYTIKGKYNVLTTVKSMLNFAVKDGLIKTLPPFPALSIGLPDTIEYLTYEEQQKVLQAIPERHRPIFELAMEYGLRIGEVCAIKKDCITDNEIIIKRSFSNGELRETTKTGRTRTYIITEYARSTLSKTTSFSDYIFTRNGKEPYQQRGLNKIWTSACKNTGCTVELYNAVRHSLGCQLMDEGQPIELVRDILGHTSTNMTRRYAKRNPAQVQSALEQRGKVIAFTKRLPNEKGSYSNAK